MLIILGIRLAISPATYASTARVRVEYDQSDISGFAQHGPVATYDPYLIQTEFEVIQSAAVLGKAIQALDLNKEWGIRYAGGHPLKLHETMTLLKGRLDLRPVRNTSLIEIRVFDDRPDEAARIANAVAEAYRAHRRDQRIRMSKDGIKALEDRFQEQQDKVKRAQQIVDKLREDLNINNVVASAESPQPLMTADTLRKLESLRIETQAEYTRQRTLTDRLNMLKAELGPEGVAQSLASAVPDTMLTAFLEHLSTAELQLVSLTKELGPQNIEIIKLKSEIEALHARIKARVEGVMLGLETRALSLSNSLDNLVKEVGQATTNDVIRANQTRPYFEAKRNLEELQHFRQILDVKLGSEKIGAGQPHTAVVDLIDRAVPPLRPGPANLRLGLALVVLGVLLDITGFFMLRGRPGAVSEPRPA